MPAQPAATGPTRTQPGGTRTSPAQPPGRRRAGTRARGPRDGAGWNDTARAGTGRNAAGPRESRRRRSARRPAGLGRWGTLQGGLGVCIIVASAAIGTIATMVARRPPGSLLGVLVVAGTAAAALAVRPRAGRMIFPVPALAYLVAALISGVVYDRSADSSKTALALGATQWVANGFFAMVLGTVLAIAVTTARWYLWRRAQPASWDPGWQVPRTDTTWAGPAAGDTGPVRPGTGQPPTFHPTPDPRDGARPGGTGPRPGPRPGAGSGPGSGPGAGSGPGSGPYNFSSGA
jgi:hypothetical protein